MERTTLNCKAELPRRRVLVIDSHALVRQGLVLLIHREAGLTACAAAGTAAEALDALRQSHPDAIVLDIALADGDGLDLLRTLAAELKRVPVLVLSDCDERIFAERSLRAGAMGYVMKCEPPEHIMAALRQVIAGRISISETVEAQMLRRASGRGSSLDSAPLDALTDRELQVLRLIGSGLSMRQIAGQLYLSIKTINAHRDRIRRKLHLQNCSEVLRYAMQSLTLPGAGAEPGNGLVALEHRTSS
jgi:DNA-binding NarL/FixJ family response regulator